MTGILDWDEPRMPNLTRGVLANVPVELRILKAPDEQGGTLDAPQIGRHGGIGPAQSLAGREVRQSLVTRPPLLDQRVDPVRVRKSWVMEHRLLKQRGHSVRRGCAEIRGQEDGEVEPESLRGELRDESRRVDEDELLDLRWTIDCEHDGQRAAHQTPHHDDPWQRERVEQRDDRAAIGGQGAILAGSGKLRLWQGKSGAIHGWPAPRASAR